MKVELCIAAAAVGLALPAAAEDIKLRIASGHPTANTYVNLMNTFFVPEVTKRVAARTKHKVEFVEPERRLLVQHRPCQRGPRSHLAERWQRKCYRDRHWYGHWLHAGLRGREHHAGIRGRSAQAVVELRRRFLPDSRDHVPSQL